MAIGIEFLGKCLNSHEDWNEPKHSKEDFELAINTLDSFVKYRPLLKSHNFWTSLRNGLLHSFAPKSTITLSSKNEAGHPGVINYKFQVVNDVYHGEWNEYWLNGQVAIKGQYVNGKKHGIWITYYEDGSIRAKWKFEHGAEIRY